MARTPALTTGAFALVGALALAGCASGDPLDAEGDGGGSGGDAGAIVIGSQDYYSNEIIAEIYAQSLEEAGFTVEREYRIGQREVYMPELEAGEIDLLPEYTGNLLQYFDPEATVTSREDVYAALEEALPEGLHVLDDADATDQDSYVVTAEFAEEHSLAEIGDLAGVDGLVLGGNSELETRPYGPEGLSSVYGVDVSFTPIEDSGGPLTVKALRDGDVQLADIYSADPVLAEGDLVVLEDPESLFLASHVVPVVSDNVDEEAAAVIDEVSADLTAEDLIQMNATSVQEESSAEVIAADWLASR
ncbi:ABC transporter substrate-binding protein [Gulosibacter sp. 10]|uniref:ABC transporter substrate-binding protein n=1 Tax=Gulosibacter sp. 10 TaxID=1255570 RepID=UPI00097F45D6|nr:ABC transporter substrate-binding protein [Gulosibacter sp. 10]SJM51689.1 L-proline glycine betaine binding ABC transporter protein ProX (TC 3.A.1.12.1) [Gulosibacter sp. 10]